MRAHNNNKNFQESVVILNLFIFSLMFFYILWNSAGLPCILFNAFNKFRIMENSFCCMSQFVQKFYIVPQILFIVYVYKCLQIPSKQSPVAATQCIQYAVWNILETNFFCVVSRLHCCVSGYILSILELLPFQCRF